MRPNPRFCVVSAPPHGAGAVGGAVALATGAVVAVVLLDAGRAASPLLISTILVQNRPSTQKKSILGST